MNSERCHTAKSIVLDEARNAGAVAAGCAVAAPVPDDVRRTFLEWIGDDRHGSMDYLARNLDVRFDPRLLLPDARTVVSLAFPYKPAGGVHHPHFADFALGSDYHFVLRSRLAPLVQLIEEKFGATARVCVDSAPILERYWAHRAGLGFIGMNHQFIVPGIGSEVFLAEIVTSLELPPDSPLPLQCQGCAGCVVSCPSGALTSDGFDARACRSYLTIEHRGDLPLNADLGQCVAGCDDCQRHCPHNSTSPDPLEEFAPSPALMALDREALLRLSSGDWKRLTRHSPLSRIPYRQFRRNLEAK